MRIKDHRANEVPFGIIKPGEIFGSEANVYIKTVKIDDKYLAVDLEDGEIAEFELDCPVEELRGLVVLE